jgi:glycosyltransferase involved in cell wall biosynthesis
MMPHHKPLDIALVSHDVMGGMGQGRVNFELTRALLENGIDVTLYAAVVDCTLIEAGAQWVPVQPIAQSPDLLRVWDFRRRATQILKQRTARHDLIVACGAVLDIPHDVNIVHFIHSTWRDSPFHPREYGPSINSWYQKVYTDLNCQWEKDAWTAASRIVAVSDRIRLDLIDLGYSSQMIDVIANGVDISEYQPGESKRSLFGLPSEPCICLFVGDIASPIKNLDTLLKALVRVPTLHCAIAGDLRRSPYPEIADRLGINSRVHFLGYQDNIPFLMQSVDFFVLPSHQDSFGLVVTEALASGLPVIASKNVGASFLIDNTCGFVYDPPTDHSRLSQLLQVLSRDKSLRQRLSDGARKRALLHSWNNMCKKYLSYFNSLANSVDIFSIEQ